MIEYFSKLRKLEVSNHHIDYDILRRISDVIYHDVPTSTEQKFLAMQDGDRLLSLTYFEAPFDWFMTRNEPFNIGLPPSYNNFWHLDGKVEFAGLQFSGAIPKRIRKLYYELYGLRLSKGAVSEIGNIISEHRSKNTCVYAICTDWLDWEDGDFGDNGSCYWSCRNYARIVMEEIGYKAILLFDAASIEEHGLERCTSPASILENGGKGIGRVLVQPLTDTKLVLHNWYRPAKNNQINLEIISDYLCHASGKDAVFESITYDCIHSEFSSDSPLFYVNDCEASLVHLDGDKRWSSLHSLRPRFEVSRKDNAIQHCWDQYFNLRDEKWKEWGQYPCCGHCGQQFERDEFGEYIDNYSVDRTTVCKKCMIHVGKGEGRRQDTLPERKRPGRPKKIVETEDSNETCDCEGEEGGYVTFTINDGTADMVRSIWTNSILSLQDAWSLLEDENIQENAETAEVPT